MRLVRGRRGEERKNEGSREKEMETKDKRRSLGHG